MIVLAALLIMPVAASRRLAAVSSQAKESPVQDWLAQAKQAESERNLPRAAECYVNHLKEHPDDAVVNQRLGLVYYLLNRYQEAILPLQHALKLDQKLWPSALFLGQCYFRLGQFERALDPLNLTLRINPGLPEGNFWLGSALSGLDRNEEAIEKLQKVPSDSPVGLDADYLLVKLYRKMAESYYLRLKKAAPDSGRVHQLVAEALIWRNRDLEAISEYREALSRQPQVEGVHRTIGDLYWQQKRLEEARKEYESELRLTPLSDITNLRLGQYWLAHGKVEEGAHYLDFALKLNKDLSEANRDLGEVWVARGDYAKGEPLLKTAVRQNPDDVLTHRFLADLYRRTNRNDLAGKEETILKDLRAASEKEE